MTTGVQPLSLGKWTVMKQSDMVDISVNSGLNKLDVKVEQLSMNSSVAFVKLHLYYQI